MKVAFIIGSPRSGTTILGDIMNCHPEIAEWYEPYFLWERYFPCKEDDIWKESDLDEQARQGIHKEYLIFQRKVKKSIILEKSPGHEFNLGIIQGIFPEAKWIHVLRDGRDVTLSIRKEWARRQRLVERRNFTGLFQVAMAMLKRQTFWRYRLMAVLYELRSSTSLNPVKYLNKARWRGNVGWGSRFSEWKRYLGEHSELEFNAMQWVRSVEAVQRNWNSLPKENRVEVRYEDLLRFPETTLGGILGLLEVEPTDDFFRNIPPLKRDNFKKWKKEFTSAELKEISPVLTEKLLDLGYEKDPYWANHISNHAKENEARAIKQSL